MPRTTYFTISTGADMLGKPKDGLLFSKVSDDDDNCEYMVIEVEDIRNPPFIKKRIQIKDIRAIAELFTKWADELDGIDTKSNHDAERYKEFLKGFE